MADTHKALRARTQQTLPEGKPAEQIDAILDRPDAELYIRNLEGATLYQLIKEAGWDQGVDLVPYASGDQVQTFIDFDGWRRDRFIPQRLNPWLAAMTQEASDERFKTVLRELDSEAIALYFKSFIEEVHETEEGRIPDEASDRAVMSPDGTYALVYPEDEDQATLLKAILERLYEVDRVLAWTLIEAARWEVGSEMEEYARRWRISRLEEYGFVAPEEAHAVYSPLDPAKLKARLEAGDEKEVMLPRGKENLDLPTVMETEFDEEFFIMQVLFELDDDTLQRRLFELQALLNKVLISDGVEPGELTAGRQVVRRTLGYASLGLEYLSEGDAERAQSYLERLALRDIFRAGFTLTLSLQRQATQLENRPTLGILEGLPYSLLNPDEVALMEGLTRKRPTYAKSWTEHALFEHPEQIDEVAVRLSRIAFKQLWTFGLRRVGPDNLVELATREDLLNEPIDVTFDTLFGTWMARHFIGDPQGVEPLGREELGELLVALRDEEAMGEPVREVFAGAFSVVTEALPEGTDILLERWAERTRARLISELGEIREARDAQIVHQVILLKGEQT